MEKGLSHDLFYILVMLMETREGHIDERCIYDIDYILDEKPCC